MTERVNIKSAATQIGFKDGRSLRQWCRRYGIEILWDEGCKTHYILKKEFDEAANFSAKKYIIKKYDCSIEEFNARMSLEVQLRKAIEGNRRLTPQLPRSHVETQQEFSTVKIDSQNTRVTLANMEEPLFIPPNKRIHGLGLTVFCYGNECKTNVSDKCPFTGKSLKNCPNGHKHVFKVYVYDKVHGGRRTKVLVARDVDSAIQEAIQFAKEVNGNAAPKTPKSEAIEGQKENQKTYLLIDSISDYIQWLKGVNVPEHLRKERSAHFIGEVDRKLKLFIECLKKNGHDLSVFKVTDLNDKIIGEFYKYLNEQKRFGSNTFNKHISYGSSWLKWFSNEHYPVHNWFAKVKRRASNRNPMAINHEEYLALLNRIRPEHGIQQLKDEKKIQHYRYWLSDAIKLGLETGRRREEILKLKFNGIVVDKTGRPEFIKIEDFKFNRSQNRFREEEKKYIYIPVTDSLYHLLHELNYEKYKGTDKYILAPEETFQREKAMKDTISRSFAHYIKQVTDRPLTFRCLRKNYITSLSLLLGGNAKVITGHSNNAVIDEYYLVKEDIARKAKALSIFGNEREEELEQIRNTPKAQKKEITK